MNERKTISMLQRVPVILAVTAVSYGLPLQAQSQASQARAGKSVSRPAATDAKRPVGDPRLMHQR